LPPAKFSGQPSDKVKAACRCDPNGVKMLEEPNLGDLEKLEHYAFLNKLLQLVVGVIGKGHDGKYGSQIGTGSFVRFHGIRGILTAQHVVEGCSESEMHFFPPSPNIQIEGPYTRPTKALAGRRTIPISQIWQDPDVDLAFAMIREDADIDHFWTFQDLISSPSTPAVGEKCTMIGFPFDLSRVSSHSEGRVNLSVRRRHELPIVVEPSRFRSDKFDPAVHFAVTFPSAGKFGAGGFSGSALWRCGRLEQGIWNANPELLGVVVTELKGLLKAVGTQRVLEFLHAQRSSRV